jgi:hypothetical protein
MANQRPNDPDDVAARVRAERAEQGLPPHITDPATIARIAGLLGADDPHRRERRLAGVRRELRRLRLRVRLDDD